MFSKLYRLYLSKDRKFNRKLFWSFGVVPKKPALYHEAFTHVSLQHKHPYNNAPVSNERLEFLGDAVLDMVVAEVLYKKYPYKDEGFLTEMRSKVVSRKQLSVLGKRIGIQPFITYSKNYKLNPQAASIMIGNAFEAFLGALYLDMGYQRSRKYIKNRVIERFINFQDLEVTEISYKSRLHKWCQQNKQTFKVRHEKVDLEHKGFVHKVGIAINGSVLAEAKSYSKKKAIEQACQRVCEDRMI